MSTVQEIESAINRLPGTDKWKLFNHLQHTLEEEWDREIESDHAKGALDSLIAEVRSDIAAGKVRPLNEILDHH